MFSLKSLVTGLSAVLFLSLLPFQTWADPVEPPPLAAKMSKSEKAAAIASYERLMEQAPPLQVGDSEKELLHRLGPPEGVLSVGSKKKLNYGPGYIMVEGGKVTQIVEVPAGQLAAPDAESYRAYQEARGQVRYMGRWMSVVESLDAYERALDDQERSEERIQAGKASAAKRRQYIARTEKNYLDIRRKGAEIQVEDLVVPGKITVVDFYADWCAPCRKIAPYLVKLSEQHPDIVVRKVDIVNWKSPVAKQWKLRSIPNMRVYDKNGRMVGEPTHDLKQIVRYINSIP